MNFRMSSTIAIILATLVAWCATPAFVNGQETQASTTSVVPGPSPDAERESATVTPGLEKIIPLAAELSGRLVALEHRLETGLDVSAEENRYVVVAANVRGLASQFLRLQETKEYKYSKLVSFRATLKQERELFDEICQPLSQAIRQLGVGIKEWHTEKDHWQEWESSLRTAGEYEPLKKTFIGSLATIDTAQGLVRARLELMLSGQEKAGQIQADLYALTAECDSLLIEERRRALLDTSPPMFSYRYVVQFGKGALWRSVQTGLYQIAWPDSRFFARQGWVIIIQGGLSFLVIFTLYRKRRLLMDLERWRFLVARPVSAGLFMGFVTTVLIYEYAGAPSAWKLANTMVGGFSFARLAGGVVDVSWKRTFLYGVTLLLVIIRFLDIVNCPMAIVRLYTFMGSLMGLLFCLRWAKTSVDRHDADLYRRLLHLTALYFAMTMMAEIVGKKTLAVHLFVSFIRSTTTVLVFVFFLHLIHGGVEWLFRNSRLRRVAVLHNDDTDTMIHRVTRFLDVVVWGLVLLPVILMIWGLYDSLEEAMHGVLALGINLGAQRVSIGLLLASAGLLYGSFFVSWLVEKLLVDEVLIKRRVEKGVRLSMARLAHYGILFVGFIMALSVLGFDVTKLTIMLSALGVGIGFGLQDIVKNFISGLILLFERPVRVGDSIEVAGKWAEIKRIGLRATIIKTTDEADVIIPNSDLVSNQVTNWTLSSRLVRMTVPVGVAYGSDVALVMETLIASAKGHAMVASMPTPQVLFLSFGESSLDFELRVWVANADDRFTVISELHQDIDRLFRDKKIEIAFPQQDIHVRSFHNSTES